MQVAVHFDSDDGLKREQYMFVLLGSTLTFDSYSTMERATKRHHFKVLTHWSRLRFHVDGARYVTKPALTPQIRARAHDELMRAVTVE